MVNSVTTLFIGAHYQMEGGMTTKYYFAGGQRIAMRTPNNNVSYLLSDHLGSTSLTTDASGNVISELRYTAWGEVRYQAGTTPTNYTYTGQYSNTADFGLMFYNARWYDPAIGRFAQADTIVPGGVQGLDRYAYVQNNPLKYTDPTGNQQCNYLKNWKCDVNWSSLIEQKFGWNVLGHWSQDQLYLLWQAGQDIEASIDGGLSAMRVMFGHVVFELIDNLKDSYGRSANGLTLDRNIIQLDSKFELVGNADAMFEVAHELGHIWDARNGWALHGAMQKQVHSTFGPGGSPGDGPGATGWSKDPSWNPTEDFAQSFAGYIYSSHAEALSVQRHGINYCPGGTYNYCYSNFMDTPRGQFLESQFPSVIWRTIYSNWLW